MSAENVVTGVIVLLVLFLVYDGLIVSGPRGGAQ